MDSLRFPMQDDKNHSRTSLCSVCQKTGDTSLFGRYAITLDGIRSHVILCKECATNGKHCSRCKTYLPFTAFEKTKIAINRGGTVAYCRPCMREYKKSKRNREINRRQTLKQFWNLTVEEYEEKLASQNGVCKICGRPEKAKDKNGNTKSLAIDHDHVTGQIRGLLCNRCNIFVGMIEGPYYQQVLKYIEEYKDV